MKRFLIAAAALSLGGCAAGYGHVDYAGGPYAYNGFYDDFYGPVYDGYWGDDGFFYYRGGAHERHFRRGDATHFRRDVGPDRGRFHAMQGSFNPGRGMRMPHFSGGPHPRGHD